MELPLVGPLLHLVFDWLEWGCSPIPATELVVRGLRCAVH